ncbi:RND family efflux transporter MFP subunit [Ulvibacter sp. MAR_2010_11]|uniref:efflux RND transporter periplasmic adaptor subunit n=1 Tax=Ulvibacter sp. MAR_2010_11 TaxID=1250229 RepID=UPI000C2C2EBB|nr:efflux RND transporter periplasmic adaptor subunit [Ulvibacter sp. MAR_2010_11]PKA81938.1 RND family efflux transporter MFP subunit [Ulvibacter sp. MAR_2010_11]
MKTKTIFILITLLAVIGIAYTLFTNKQELNEQANIKEQDFAVPVQVVTVSQKSLTDALTATGEFRGWEEVTLVAESQGSIEYLRFEEGDKVNKGQIIAKIDAVSLGAQLSSARSSFAKAEKDVERYIRLEKAGAVSKTQLEDMRLQMENAQTNIAQINQQLSFTTVKSPIDGIINTLMVEETSFVMPGNEIAEIVQVDKLKLIVNVSESELSKIREGQEVKIKTDVFPLKEFSGKVSNISVKGDASRKYKVTLEVKNIQEEKLRAGMFGEVHFDAVASAKQSALVIPRESIAGSLQNPQIYIVKDNVAFLTTIKTGATINGDVVVLSGLSAGDLVVTKGIINLKDNTKVKITK